MAENKTAPTGASVEAFLETVPEPRRTDARAVAAMLGEVSGLPPVMWGPAIVGFGSHRYLYESGRSGETPLLAFSPRKAALVLYLAGAFPKRAELLARLGRHTTGKACLYIKRLADVDEAVLRELAAASLASTGARVSV